ncbi:MULTISPECIES: hydrogenase maturation protease [unclassified Synechocystis]|uniref:hydrogenase maturation protease n=1 Tax=unclassified Synechocystis TaxID=2640012 RepID=UPI000421776B|nr:MULTISPECIES: hydrogenase maturation protease [unclassified Synechocystis]AIE75362.1 NADH-reducing hydrogenase maturation factor [Synechocystis sp. PCC 6714]MCT0253597.1 hydrogenase maturation protease [Synechocystis sp. CS-94]
MAGESTKSTLIIGYGNTLRGDDGVGRYLAEEIDQQNWPHCRVISTHQLTPELAEAIAAVDRVIFIDAQCHENQDSPTVELKALHLPTPEQLSGQLGHRGSPWELIALAKILYGAGVEAWWVLIPAFAFDYGETLSPLTAEAQAEALTKIRPLALGEI